MKKIFTFVAAALMAVSSFAAKETVLDVNFAEFASEQIGTLDGSDINVTFGEQVNKMNTNVYSLSVDGLLEADKIYTNRNSDMLVRYKDIRTIGLYSKSTPTVVIPDLQKDDIVEIAWNAGGKGDGTYWAIDSTLTSLSNVEETGEWGEYAFSHTSGGTERTINYSTRQLKVQADGDIRFAVPSVKGDGSNWKMFIAYIKVTRGSDEYEIVKEEYDFQALGQAQESEGTVDVTFGTEVLTSPASIKLISFGEETFENRFAGNRDWAIRKHSNAAYCGLYNKNGYNNRYLAIMGLEEGNEVTIDFLCDSEQSFIFENAIVEDATAGDALVSGTTYTISEDGNLILNEGANTKDKRVYIYKVTISKKVAKEGGDDTPTAIEDVKSSVKAVKMVENGQVVIVRDGVRYNALGTRL